MRVIAEAYGREPLDREMVGHQNGLCYLVKSDSPSSSEASDERGVGFPERYVFSFDESLFASLTRAFTDGDQPRLEGLWAKAQSIMEHA